MAVGRISDSPSDIVGNSSGNPPACHTPRLTALASSRKCELQGVSSEKVLAIPMTGRPSNTSGVNPSARTQERCTKPSLPGAPNQAALRRGPPFAAPSGWLPPAGCMSVPDASDELSGSDCMSGFLVEEITCSLSTRNRQRPPTVIRGLRAYPRHALARGADQLAASGLEQRFPENITHVIPASSNPANKPSLPHQRNRPSRPNAPLTSA